MNIKEALPWQTKIAAKILLARLPLGYRLWQKMNLFKHGQMERPQYALDVFTAHFGRVEFSRKTAGFSGLEIGPGDTLFSAVIAKTFGASRLYLVDTGPFARRDVKPYLEMAAELKRIGRRPPPALENCEGIDQVLSVCSAVYLTNGVNSFRAIPDASVDFIWSQAVLEHVRQRDFPMLVREMRRVLRPGGVCSHRVDLKDHLGGRLDNLRFSERLWESEFMAGSGFYTNRIRYSEMLQEFEAGGFSVRVVRKEQFSDLPTPRKRMAERFRTISDEDLMVSGFDVILRTDTEVMK